MIVAARELRTGDRIGGASRGIVTDAPRFSVRVPGCVEYGLRYPETSTPNRVHWRVVMPLQPIEITREEPHGNH